MFDMGRGDSLLYQLVRYNGSTETFTLLQEMTMGIKRPTLFVAILASLARPLLYPARALAADAAVIQPEGRRQDSG